MTAAPALPVTRSTPAPSPLRRLAAVSRPWWGALAVVAALVLASAALELVPPLVMRAVIDGHLTPRNPAGLPRLALLYVAATSAVYGTSALAAYLMAVTAQGVLHTLRTRLFAHFQRLPIGYHDRTPLGEIISRCTSDVETLDTLFSSGVASLVADLFRLVTVAVAMVSLSPPLALVAALVLPPLALATRVIQVRMRDAERANRVAIAELNTRLHETLAGVEVIRVFRQELRFVAQFRQALARVVASYNQATVYNALYLPAISLLPASATALLLWGGAGRVFAPWAISLGTLTAFVLLFQQFFKPIATLGEQWQTVQSALAGTERIFQVLALPVDEAAAPTGPVPTPEAAPASVTSDNGRAPVAELRDVTFGYVPECPVLRGVSLALRPGEHVALVGRTGAGKTSMISLLGGLYEPWSGGVRLAGRDPRGLAADERALLGVVPQTLHVLNGTILENLTLYDPKIERAEVERAARLTGAHEVIASLPESYATRLSGSGRGGGAQLSAGQLQLLALTRALVRGPRVLLLDEATAAIDSASEAAFRAGLRAGTAASGCAVLVVAHRLSTAREADRVMVLEAGQVVEEGPPSALLERGGRFAALADLEAWGWRAGE